MSSNEKRIKSALEIALERAESLGRLSPEESQRLKEEELALAGKALAKRYLAGLPLRDVDIELDKRRDEDRRVLIRYLWAGLLEAINIDNGEGNERALQAVRHLSGNSAPEQSIKALLQEYRRAREEAWQEVQGALERAKKDELALEGISGSAVEANIEASLEWRHIQERLRSSYQKRLEDVKASWKGF